MLSLREGLNRQCLLSVDALCVRHSLLSERRDCCLIGSCLIVDCFKITFCFAFVYLQNCDSCLRLRETDMPTSTASVPLSAVGGRSKLRSAQRGDVVVPRTTTSALGPRSFRIAAPVVWNSLPSHFHSSTISRRQFRAGLKTHLFQAAYACPQPPITAGKREYIIIIINSSSS